MIGAALSFASSTFLAFLNWACLPLKELDLNTKSKIMQVIKKYINQNE